MIQHALGTFRHNLWDKPSPPEKIQSGTRLRTSTRSDLKDTNPRAAYNWATVQKAVNATIFWKRAAGSAAVSRETGVDLGSMQQFFHKTQIKKKMPWSSEQENEEKMKEEAKKKAEFRNAGGDETLRPQRPQTVPTAKFGGSRRVVVRVGNGIAKVRDASPRMAQLRGMLPKGDCSEEDIWARAWARTEGLPLDFYLKSKGDAPLTVRTPRGASSRPDTAPGKSMNLPGLKDPGKSSTLGWSSDLRGDKATKAPRQKKEGETGFTLAIFSGNGTKPRAEVHSLLTAIEGMQHDEVFSQSAVESGNLSQRLDELRWGELRKGAWTNQPERRNPFEKDIVSPDKQQKDLGAFEAPGRLLVLAAIDRSSVAAGVSDLHGSQDQMDRLIHIMDPEGVGSVAPEMFVPLFFWLGLTRRRTAVLMTLELAFGPGNIDVAGMKKLSKYAEVQIRLIEGLRQLARRESLEQLSEYITDMGRLRTWFHTMKRDTTGHADIVEVQNLFARMEVTSDRQTLFRFLTHIVHSDVLPSSWGKKDMLRTRTFGIGDFSSLLCRCAVAWCIHRTLTILSPSESWKGDGDGPMMMPAADLDREAETRWVVVQRKIIMSLLVNHRFWGRESRTVLMSLTQPQMTVLGNQLSPEQWLSLFQRVRAQGIASTLPNGDEADDPDWLRKKSTASSSKN